jgi:hypothetical protein
MIAQQKRLIYHTCTIAQGESTTGCSYERIIPDKSFILQGKISIKNVKMKHGQRIPQ